MALRSSSAQLRSWLSSGMRTGNGSLKSSFSTSSAKQADSGSGHESSFKIWPLKGVYAPVYVAVGLIALSVGFGVHTASHQIKWAPGVRVKKSKRETVPEVVEPEAVAEESSNFINNSFFRKVAHVQDSDRQDVMSNPISGDVYAKQNRPRIETLKDVGVETPKEASPYKKHNNRS